MSHPLFRILAAFSTSSEANLCNTCSTVVVLHLFQNSILRLETDYLTEFTMFLCHWSTALYFQTLLCLGGLWQQHTANTYLYTFLQVFYAGKWPSKPIQEHHLPKTHTWCNEAAGPFSWTLRTFLQFMRSLTLRLRLVPSLPLLGPSWIKLSH